MAVNTIRRGLRKNMEESITQSTHRFIQTKKFPVARISGEMATALEIALDKGMNISFEKDEESGDITLLVG